MFFEKYLDCEDLFNNNPVMNIKKRLNMHEKLFLSYTYRSGQDTSSI